MNNDPKIPILTEIPLFKIFCFIPFRSPGVVISPDVGSSLKQNDKTYIKHFD